MIETYLQQIDELLSTCPFVSEVQILRRSIRDTELEKVLNYRYRVTLADGGFVELTERILEVGSSLEVTKYRHHWQASTGKLIKRWDNAPHHPEVDTFPDHLHDGIENQVVSHAPINGLEVLRLILDDLE